MQLLRRAIANRWLTDDLRPLAIQAIKDGLASKDERAKQSAIKNLLMMESQNQKDEQHDDHLRLDEGRNRVLALLGRGGAGESSRLIEPRGEVIVIGSDQQPSSKPAGRKGKGRKSQ